MRTMLVAIVLVLSGCQDIVDLADALSTPQSQCEATGGKWVQITTYDAKDNATSSFECVTNETPGKRR